MVGLSCIVFAATKSCKLLCQKKKTKQKQQDLNATHDSCHDIESNSNNLRRSTLNFMCFNDFYLSDVHKLIHQPKITGTYL